MFLDGVNRRYPFLSLPLTYLFWTISNVHVLYETVQYLYVVWQYSFDKAFLYSQECFAWQIQFAMATIGEIADKYSYSSIYFDNKK